MPLTIRDMMAGESVAMNGGGPGSGRHEDLVKTKFHDPQTCATCKRNAMIKKLEHRQLYSDKRS